MRNYAKQFATQVFVETGTFQGEMIFAVKGMFADVYSIELGSQLYEQCVKRFSRFRNIHLFNGDSALTLPRILASLNRPGLFWLDAHYSMGVTARGVRETPIREELGLILSHPIQNHVILIDDARAFTGANDYPSLDEVELLVSKERPNHRFEVKDDIIRILPATR